MCVDKITECHGNVRLVAACLQISRSIVQEDEKVWPITLKPEGQSSTGLPVGECTRGRYCGTMYKWKFGCLDMEHIELSTTLFGYQSIDAAS